MRTHLLAAAILAAASLNNATQAIAAEHVEVGRLDCDVSAGIGVIVGSQQEIKCVFAPSAPGPSDSYVGKITQFGLDIGEIKAAKLAWLVFAPAKRADNALAGSYAGVSADAAIGIGLGAKVLVGGEGGTISLQPIALQGDEGFNIAAGVTSVSLHSAQ
ncbi:DUF992 domain-containing protein [Rhizobium sp.]|uniref:DUF992 domain-containing protein n=1 Tax=Rhizobium sp. TaxID=391 RepID=UPI0034C65393